MAGAEINMEKKKRHSSKKIESSDDPRKEFRAETKPPGKRTRAAAAANWKGLRAADTTKAGKKEKSRTEFAQQLRLFESSKKRIRDLRGHRAPV